MVPGSAGRLDRGQSPTWILTIHSAVAPEMIGLCEFCPTTITVVFWRLHGKRGSWLVREVAKIDDNVVCVDRPDKRHHFVSGVNINPVIHHKSAVDDVAPTTETRRSMVADPVGLVTFGPGVFCWVPTCGSVEFISGDRRQDLSTWRYQFCTLLHPLERALRHLKSAVD